MGSIFRSRNKKKVKTVTEVGRGLKDKIWASWRLVLTLFWVAIRYRRLDREPRHIP